MVPTKTEVDEEGGQCEGRGPITWKFRRCEGSWVMRESRSGGGATIGDVSGGVGGREEADGEGIGGASDGGASDDGDVSAMGEEIVSSSCMISRVMEFGRIGRF